MARLDLPPQEMNRFDVPAVCLVTGAEAGVSWRPVTFRWYPRWLLLLLVPSLLLGAIVIEVVTRRVRGELPFTDAGWRRHLVAGRLNLLAGLVAVGGAVAALIVLGIDGSGAVAAAVAGGALGLPAVLYLAGVRGRRVICRRITDLSVELEIPSAGAASLVDRYRHAGTEIPMPAVPVAPAVPAP